MYIQPQTESDPKGPFIGLCLYLGSQAITVPIVALGNWAIWPSLSDFAWLAFVVLSLPYLFREKSYNWGVLRLLLAVLLGSMGSYVILTLFWPVLHEIGSDKGELVGLYQLYRLAQFVIVFWLATKIPLSAARLSVIHWVCTGACVFVCVSCIVTYWFLPTSLFCGHLSASIAASGPWAPFIHGVEHIGVGATSYNHCYTGIHIMLLAALAAQTRRPSMLPPWLAVLAFLAIFISEHRTGLIFFVLYICLLFQPSVKYVVSSVFLLAILSVLAAYTWTDTYPALADAIDRHSTITTSYSTDGFSARDQIWTDRIEFLNENIARWIIGSGFGSALESGQNAHMLYLHIVIETGLFGLTIFLAIMGRILYVIWLNEASPHSLFWVTVCLLGTCFTQETFYPVAAFGHFIGLFLCAVAIAIRTTCYECPENDEYSESSIAFPSVPAYAE